MSELIDISYWEPNIKWNILETDGVVIRAGGGYLVDPYFKQHTEGAMASGKPFTFYWAFYPRLDPERQATLFYNTIRPYLTHPQFGLGPELMKVVFGDCERSDGLTVYSVAPRVKRFLAKLDALLPLGGAGAFAGVYTRKTWWDLYVGVGATWAGYYPLWTAHYALPRPGVPWVPQAWRKLGWVLWQYSDRGHKEGVYDNNGRLTGVDLNRTSAT